MNTINKNNTILVSSSVAFCLVFVAMVALGVSVPATASANTPTCGGTVVSKGDVEHAGLRFRTVSNVVYGPTNVLAINVKNNNTSGRTITVRKFECRCQSNQPFCGNYWTPSDTSNPIGNCREVLENHFITAGQSKNIQLSVTQYNNMVCGGFQLDMFLTAVNGNPVSGTPVAGMQRGKYVGSSFTDLCTSCSVPAPTPTPTPGTGQCSNNNQCGTDGFIETPFCSSTDVFQKYRTWTCNNPGMANSTCTFSDDNRLKQDCPQNSACLPGGVCGNSRCTVDSDCGSNGYVHGLTCQNNNVFQTYRTWTCFNPGTANASCNANDTPRFQTACPSTQTCTNGSCGFTNGICNSNSDCGTNGYVGENFCQGNNVVRHFETHICNNPGTTSARCSSSTQTQVVNYCAANQTCQGNTCVNQGQMSVSVTKQVRNLSTGNLTWSNSVNANPADIVQFNVTIQNSSNTTVNNVMLRDTLPSTLIYNNSLVIDGVANNSGNITGLNLGSINQGQTKTITYQTQVAGSQNFSFGTTAVRNSVTITSTDSGFAGGNASATVVVTRTQVGGATDVPTGSNRLMDFIFLPLIALAAAGVYMFRSRLFGNQSLAFGGKANNAQVATQTKLDKKIAEIKEKESSTR